MAKSDSSIRIGTTERSAAQSALQEHLNAGRLEVAEYADRSARAANATTAAELAALFSDLPAPRPNLPGVRASAPRRRAVVAGVVAVVLVGLVALIVGLNGSSPPTTVAQPLPNLAPPTEAIAPSPPVTPMPLPTTDDSAGSSTAYPSTGDGTVAALPDGATVRRTSGGEVITLRPNYGVDLDDSTSPNWKVGIGCCGRDVGFASDAGRLYIDNDYAVVIGPPQYATCSHETGYTNSALERGSLHTGETICVRTGENRYALITIVGVTEEAFQFQATVWDS